jgi:hypothetical protein
MLSLASESFVCVRVWRSANTMSGGVCGSDESDIEKQNHEITFDLGKYIAYLGEG